MTLVGTPPPDYPEYSELLAAARRAAGPFINPASPGRGERIAAARGWAWCEAVLGHYFHGVRFISHAELELLIAADAADISPPTPAWMLAEREHAAAALAELEQRRAATARRELERWWAVRDRCLVPVQCRPNINAHVRNGRREQLGHVVPLVDAFSPPVRAGNGRRSRRHRAGRALCETTARARPLELGERTTDPATCVRCLAHAVIIRPAPPETNGARP